MSDKRKPIGFIAECQCDKIVGAMDYERTPRKEAGKILGEWLQEGCMVRPVFEHNWTATVSSCECTEPPTQQ